MQIKNNHSNYLQKPWIIGLFKLGLLGGCIYYIITKFLDQSISLHQLIWPDSFILILGLIIFLMVINWYLEALRWKVSLQSFEPITIKKAWQVILGGLALNWVFPLTSGDLLVRISQQHDKYQTTSAAMLNRAIMLCITSMVGLYGITWLASGYNLNGWYFFAVVIVSLLILLLFNKALRKFLVYFKNISRKKLMEIAGLSLLRYLIFMFQFYLLLKIFMPMLSNELLIGGIGWIFLVRSALPLLLGGAGVREASGILFFEPHVSDLQIVIVPIFFIWIINTVIPSLMGLVFVYKIKVNIAR